MDATNPAQSSSSSPSKSVADSRGTAAFDVAYRFGRRPNVKAPFPFNERQFARLLILRGRLQDAPSHDDQKAA